MITDQKRTIRKAQGYDLGFEYKGIEYWINTSKWNEEKEERFYKETGLKAFREETRNGKLVFYDPKYFEINSTFDMHSLRYIGTQGRNIPQPINMTSSYFMFFGCGNLKSLDLNDWDMSNVRLTEGMFSYCEQLSSLSIEDWDVSNVRDANHMFDECKNLKSLDLSKWDVSNIGLTFRMFARCKTLHTLKLSNWDMSSNQTMYGMFEACSALHDLDLTNWKICSGVDLENMFLDCVKLHLKYNTEDNKELLHKIIEDSNNKSLQQLNAF